MIAPRADILPLSCSTDYLKEPGVLVGARLGSPLVLGLNEGEGFLASDASALAGRASKVVYLDDHQICVLKADDWKILNRNRLRVPASVHNLEIEASDLEPGEYGNFMLKEIYEQPDALRNAMRGRFEEIRGRAIDDYVER